MVSERRLAGIVGAAVGRRGPCERSERSERREGMHQKARDALVGAVPVGRIGVPDDIWLAVKFVVECDYFNGRCVDVDGGLVM